MEETKKCPFCAEEIKIEAKKCKHCGSMLEEEDVKNKAINKKTFIEIMKEQNKVNKSKYLTGKQTLIVF
jgi:hypothetical protein